MMTAGRHHRMEIGDDRIAVLTLDMADKSVNVLTSEFVHELTLSLQRLHAMKEVAGLLIRSAKKKQFIAGADVGEILAIDDAAEAAEKSRLGQEMMRLIETLKFPSAAAIDGPCLGGGMELALACTYRVAGEGPHVRLGLPEVKLGIIPGWGGTQRLPHVVGVLTAVDLIASGRTVDGRRAFQIGLADDYAASEIVEDVAREWLTRQPKRFSRLPLWKRVAENTPLIRKPLLKWVKRKAAAAAKGAYPAPVVAVDVIRQTFQTDNPLRYELEARKVGELITTPVSKSLIRLFQASEEIRKEKSAVPPREIAKAAVLGAGVMGGGIAHLLASKNRTVRLRDVSVQALAKGMQAVRDLSKKTGRREAAATFARIAPTAGWSGLRRVDFVIEAVPEKIEIKRKVFAEAAEHLPPDTVLATNTSALSVTEIAAAVPNPQRVIGLHFFNPVHRMPLVEVIRGTQTSEETLSTTLHLALALGKTPIVAADRPGFLVNRILGLYLNEAACAAEEGTSVAEIERAMKAFGLPMGPFELMDEIGIDTAAEVGAYLAGALPHFPKASPLLSKLRQDQRLGKKNGRGFYLHAKGKKKLDERYLAMILPHPEPSKKTETAAARHAKLTDRLILLMVNEAARCLEENVVRSSRDIEIGMVLGTGFPPFRGGLLAYANSRGLRQVSDTLLALSQTHGGHFHPAKFLSSLAHVEGKF